jgi:Tfp pilus assembly protein PilF
MRRMLAQGALVSGGNFNHFTSHVVRQLMESDELAAFVTQLRASYADRAQAMDVALRKHLGGIAHWRKPAGGYFFWLELSEGADAGALEAAARAAGTGFLPGTACSSSSGTPALSAPVLCALFRARNPRGHRAPRARLRPMKPSRSSLDNPRLRLAAIAMNRNDVPQAEQLLKAHLYEAPTDVPAIRMLAEVAMRVGRDEDAKHLLERALELAPGFMPARYQLAVLLHRLNDASRALAEIKRLLAAEPRNPGYRNLAAVILSRVGEYERSSAMYADLLKEYPTNAKVWLSYGHVLKTQGRQDESIAAYRHSIARDPAFGEAYWSLANLKTFRFTDTDLAAMRACVEDPAIDEANRVHLHFALGKAHEDAGRISGLL